jgi:hypothetical protein
MSPHDGALIQLNNNSFYRFVNSFGQQKYFNSRVIVISSVISHQPKTLAGSISPKLWGVEMRVVPRFFEDY